MASRDPFSSAGSSLRVMEALSDGWDGFKRSPGPLVIFTLIWGAVSLITSGMQQTGTLAEGTTASVLGVLVSLIGSSFRWS